jgi:hypothetical protein
MHLYYLKATWIPSTFMCLYDYFFFTNLLLTWDVKSDESLLLITNWKHYADNYGGKKDVR